MKIAVIDNLPEGGAKRVVFEQLKYLSTKHEVLFCTNEIESAFPFNELPLIMKRYPLRRKQYQGVSRLWGDYRLYGELKKDYHLIQETMDDFGAEVVLAHPDRYFQASPIAAVSNIPVIYFAEEWLRLVYEPEWHPIKTDSWLKNAYEKTRRNWIQEIDHDLVRHATKIITSSDYNREHLSRAYGIDAEVISLGVDTDTFYPEKDEDLKKDYFLFIGENDHFHGYDLLDEIKKLAPYELQIKQIAFNDQAAFNYTDKQMSQIYSNAVATLCFDHNEPFGLVPLESMACATPVVAINEGGYRETVDDGVTGYLVDRDAEQIYGIMMKLASNNLLRKVMGEAGRKRVKQEFSWKKHGMSLEKAIVELCQK